MPSEDRDRPCLAIVRVKIAIVGQNCAKISASFRAHDPKLAHSVVACAQGRRSHSAARMPTVREKTSQKTGPRSCAADRSCLHGYVWSRGERTLTRRRGAPPQGDPWEWSQCSIVVVCRSLRTGRGTLRKVLSRQHRPPLLVCVPFFRQGGRAFRWGLPPSGFNKGAQ